MNNLFLKSQGFYIFNKFISFYGVIIAIGMVLGIICAYFICKKKNYNTNMPLDLALFALPCAIIGARLYYCIFYGVNSFVDVFKIWEGGMAIYGGVIGGFIGILLSCKIKKYSLLQACDLAAPCLILGQCIGRIGCYFAGCCYGIEATSPSLQVFPISVQIDDVWHLATFFYECALDFVGFIILMVLTLKTNKNGIVTSGYFITYGLIRAVLEQFRDPKECLMLGNSGIRVSQLLSIMLVILGIVMIILILKLKKEKTNE